MKRLHGFTLLELVVAIVILGLLSVVAAPKFLGLQSDARAAALSGLAGSMEGAVAIVHGKSAVQGIENQPASVSVVHLSRVLRLIMDTRWLQSSVLEMQFRV